MPDLVEVDNVPGVLGVPAHGAGARALVVVAGPGFGGEGEAHVSGEEGVCGTHDPWSCRSVGRWVGDGLERLGRSGRVDW